MNNQNVLFDWHEWILNTTYNLITIYKDKKKEKHVKKFSKISKTKAKCNFECERITLSLVFGVKCLL